MKGPIGSGPLGVGDHGPVDYALSRTYRIESPNRNYIKCLCKWCGVSLSKGHGFQVLVAERGPWTRVHYLCREHFRMVKLASEFFPLVNPMPKWWGDLDRPATEEVRMPMSNAKLGQLITQREKEVKQNDHDQTKVRGQARGVPVPQHRRTRNGRSDVSKNVQ